VLFGRGSNVPAIALQPLLMISWANCFAWLRFEFAGRANALALVIIALGRDVRTMRNVPDIGFSHQSASNKLISSSLDATISAVRL
jgi:hypothetical protein